MKHHLFLHGFAAAMLALCAACAADLGDTLADPQPIVFSAVQLEGETTFTRAATNGTWEGGEQVAIKINGVVKKYIVDESGALTPDGNTTPFCRTSTSDIAYTAWYPYSESQPSVSTLIVTDQSTTEAQEQCNLMKAEGKVNGQTATLQFSHKAARLGFYLADSDSDNAPVTGATVTVTIDDQTYTAHEDGNGYYSLLVAPQKSVSYGQDFLTITTSEKTYKATAPETATFYANKSYNYIFALKCPPYLTFTADKEQGFKMTKTGSPPDGTFEYSVNNGEWKTVTSGAEVTFGGSNGKLRLRGISPLGTSLNTDYWTISFTNDDVPVAASGDIRTLVSYKNYDTENITGSARFRCLFQNCTALTSAPELNATKLAEACYLYMFYGCTNLKTAPEELPATTLANSCYNSMFYGCTALEKAPELPATTLVLSCYNSMFWNCKNLNEVTIKAEKAAEGVTISKALDWWLYGVASNGTIHCTEAFYTTLKDLNDATILPSGWTRGDLSN